MKTIVLIIAFLVLLPTAEESGHKRGNDTCRDDIKHYQNLVGKRTDAPLWEQSKEVFGKAVAKRLAGKQSECEDLVEEALRMIRKPYVTE